MRKRWLVVLSGIGVVVLATEPHPSGRPAATPLPPPVTTTTTIALPRPTTTVLAPAAPRTVRVDALAPAAAPIATTEPTTTEPAPEPESPTTTTTEPEPEPTTTTEAPPPTTEPPTVAPAAAPPGGGWEDLRQCESGGDYTAVQRGGPGRGAYQFDQPTWDGIARHLGRDDLVGVEPHTAAPADQDAAALRLYDESGRAPWPYCGRYV